ncbi:hypothetical protein Sango_2730400 [Sesamum angolense]|uniref:Uncharacterized protein n=1 Tax=Sesamum angolense TaxID=2727404 RepID=A0AAE1T691_9LAMI|nr:hypothetical protein Sango_2730400 [Sesamum angolense]
MGIKLVEIGIKMRKGVIFTIRGCFRSVCNHPFLVVILFLLAFVFRYFPFVFSLLVSASPVLISTAVLLGTLLSLGQPDIPELETEDGKSCEAVSIKNGVSGDYVVVEKSLSHNVERHSEKRRDAALQAMQEQSLPVRKLDEICRESSANDTSLFVDKGSRGVGSENGGVREGNREVGDMRCKRKSEGNEERLSDGEAMQNRYASAGKVNDEHAGSDNEKSDADSFDSEMVNVDLLESPPHSPWKHVDDPEDEDEDVDDDDESEENDDASDSGTDQAESSSPDASVADIMPMLDELHPLLDDDAPQPAEMSRHGSEAARGRSPQSIASSNELDDETDNQADDDNEDDEAPEKEELAKSVITWTEEDQKNLMDLGSSEIERNQRLENVIMRRRARKYMSMVPEINLIDFESSDSPFHIAPITTTRQNPFDVPNDSYYNSGLPPVPGSAPSILVPRRNPFDIPFESSEEKSNIMGDGFQEEFTTSQSRESFFRRHESFNVGPAVFAHNKQDKQEYRLRPYFVPVQMIPEESSYSSFLCQSSELSDSKASSVPETESVSSVEELEEQKPAEDNPREIEVILRTDEVIIKQSSTGQELVSKTEACKEDVPQEPKLISEMKHVSEQIGHGSQSSEEESLVDKRYSTSSRSSSFSEVSERVFTETKGETEGVGALNILTQNSVGGTDLSATSPPVDEVPQKEPVYDTSPPAIRKSFSFASSSFDLHAESDPSFAPVMVKRTVTFVERDSEVISQEIEKEIMTLPELLKLHLAGDLESAPVDNDGQIDNTSSDVSGVDQRCERQGVPAVPSKSCVKVPLEEKQMDQHTGDQVPSSSSSGDKSLGESEPEKHLPISKTESLLTVTVLPFKGQQEEEHSIDKKETVVSSNSHAEVFHEANERLMSTPSAGANTPTFYDAGMHEPNFEHVEEVQVPNTPVDSCERMRHVDLNIQEIYELDSDRSPNINSPFTPDYSSMPSTASEAVKEIDEGQLSQLENAGDFRVIERGSGSTEFKECWATASGMPKVEDINVVHKQFGDEEIEKPVLLVQHRTDPVTGETITEHFESRKLYIKTSRKDSAHETTILEARDTNLGNKQVNDGSGGSRKLPDTVNDVLCVVDSGETQGTSEVHVAKTTDSEGTRLAPNKAVDSNSEKETKPKTNDGSVEVKEEKPGSSVGKETSVEGIGSNVGSVEVKAEKPNETSRKEISSVTRSVEVEAEKLKEASVGENSSNDGSVQVKVEKEKGQSPNENSGNDGSVEVKAEQAGSSVGKEASAKQINGNVGSVEVEVEKIKEPSAEEISSNAGSREVEAKKESGVEEISSSAGLVETKAEQLQESALESSSTDGSVDVKVEKPTEASVKETSSIGGLIDIEAEKTGSYMDKETCGKELSSNNNGLAEVKEEKVSFMGKEPSVRETSSPDGSVRVEAQKIGSSLASLKEISIIATEKRDHRFRAPSDLRTTISDEGKR